MTPQLYEFILAALLMELTPGPNMTWLALLSAQRGRRAGYLAVAGVALGLSLLAVAAAAGATSLLTLYPITFDLLRWAGIAFLLYLAFEAWVGEKAGAQAPDQMQSFRRGVIVNLLNPKAAAVFVVLIPTLMNADRALLSQTAFLSAIYVGIATAVHLAIVAFAGSFQKFIAEPRRELIARRLCAVALVLVAIWFYFSTTR